MKQRGAQIKAGNFQKVAEIEDKINTLKSENLEHYTRPVFAFITFEKEQGYAIGSAYDSKDPVFLGQPIKICEATEPTDIIWENRHFTDEQRKSNLFKVLISATLYLLVALVIITLLKLLGMIVTSKYVTTNCSLIKEQFGDKLQAYAYYEYKNFYDQDVDTRMTGVLQCFCQREYQNSDGGAAFYNKEYR